VCGNGPAAFSRIHFPPVNGFSKQISSTGFVDFWNYLSIISLILLRFRLNASIISHSYLQRSIWIDFSYICIVFINIIISTFP